MLKKRRLVALVTVLLVSGFLATALAGYFVSKESLRRQIVETGLPLTSDTIFSEIQNDLLPPIFVSSMMAQDTFLRDWALNGEREPDKAIKYLAEVRQRYGTVTTFFVSDKTRDYYHPSGIVEKVVVEDPTDAWYFRVRKMEADYEVNVDADQANDFKLTVFINHKVFDYDGNFIGVTGVGLEVDSMLRRVADIEKRYGREIYFVDPVGRIALAAGAGETAPTSILEVDGLGEIAKFTLDTKSGTFEYRRDGETVLLNTRYIPVFDWYLFVEQVEGNVTAGVERALVLNLAVGLAIALVVVVATNATVRVYQRRLEHMATTDTLTGIANRQAFELLAAQGIKEAGRSGEATAVMMFDIDNFKQINDRFGHLAGDQVIKDVVDIARHNLREADVLCRWGGEEFAVWLKDCPLADAQALAEKVRDAFKLRPFTVDGQPIPVTASFGVAEYEPGEGLEQVFARADEALYRAKDKGRDRVEMA